MTERAPTRLRTRLAAHWDNLVSGVARIAIFPVPPLNAYYSSFVPPEVREGSSDNAAREVQHRRFFGRRITVISPVTGEPVKAKSRDIFDVYDAQGTLTSRTRAKNLPQPSSK
jgi:hypothetical protein